MTQDQVGGPTPDTPPTSPTPAGVGARPAETDVATDPDEPGRGSDEPVLEPVERARSSAPRGGAIRLAGYPLAAAAGVLLTIGVLAASGSIGAASPTPSPSPSPTATPAYVEGNAVGDPDAPVTIEIWADYQCPYCGLQARGIEPSIEREYAATGRARIVFRDFAFLGQESVDAAVAARCAGRQDAYWYFHDLLFASQQGENQGAFARDRLVSLAQFAGLDQTAFTACLDDPAVATAVTDEKALGVSYGISSTPTVRLVGPGGTELLSGLKPLSEISAAVARVATPAASPSSSPSAEATPSEPATPSGATPSP